MTTQYGDRVHIGFFGIRNAGKSSLVNAIAERMVSIVSSLPGTTTDPVSIPMELGALGPVALVDTAGLDDGGEVGSLRVARSLERLSWADIVVLVTPLHRPPTRTEVETLGRVGASTENIVVVGTFSDLEPDPAKEEWLEDLFEAAAEAAGAAPADESPGIGQATPSPRPFPPRLVLRVSSRTGEGMGELRAALAGLGQARAAAGGPALAREVGPLEGLVERGDLVVLVTPIDAGAPRGRLILPETATLRDALDRGCVALVTRDHELPLAWAMLGKKPRLVVTDSQAFDAVVAAIPGDQSLTSFSILFARKKGELARFATGLHLLARLAAENREKRTNTDNRPFRLLAIEACTHNRCHDDIAAIRIPRELARAIGRPVEVTVSRDLSDTPPAEGYDLVVTCGGCVATAGRMRAQLDALETAGLPVLNFGIFLGWASGVFPRIMEPFAAIGEWTPGVDVAAGAL
ncbi:MAG: GTPase [Spirochaetota bacterium]